MVTIFLRLFNVVLTISVTDFFSFFLSLSFSFSLSASESEPLTEPYPPSAGSKMCDFRTTQHKEEVFVRKIVRRGRRMNKEEEEEWICWKEEEDGKRCGGRRGFRTSFLRTSLLPLSSFYDHVVDGKLFPPYHSFFSIFFLFCLLFFLSSFPVGTIGLFPEVQILTTKIT